MGAKTYVLMALPILVLVGMIALFVCLGRSRSPRLAAWADRLGLSFGARRADEMERMIQYKAVSAAYLVVIFALIGCSLYDSFIRHAPGAQPYILIALMGVLTQSIAVLILRHRSTAEDDEYKPYPLWKTFLIVLVFSLIVAGLGAGLAIAVMAW